MVNINRETQIITTKEKDEYTMLTISLLLLFLICGFYKIPKQQYYSKFKSNFHSFLSMFELFKYIYIVEF